MFENYILQQEKYFIIFNITLLYCRSLPDARIRSEFAEVSDSEVLPQILTREALNKGDQPY